MKITLAIPNFNGGENLANILKQAIEEDFDHIYVLDDNSTDNSEEVVKQFPKATFIKGKTNKGPGGNRNRVLDQKYDDVIMFVDVDMNIITKGIKEVTAANFENKDVALVGGQIITKNNEPMWWNFGYEMHPTRDAKAEIVHDWALDNWEKIEKIKELKEKYKEITPNLDISFGDKTDREVDWVSEANFCVRGEVFESVKGFDPNMRYHADQDLCKRIRAEGYKVIHSPNIKTMHLEIDTFGEDRDQISRENASYFYKKHWKMSQEVFDKLFPKIEE